eukprot:403343791
MTQIDSFRNLQLMQSPSQDSNAFQFRIRQPMKQIKLHSKLENRGTEVFLNQSPINQILNKYSFSRQTPTSKHMENQQNASNLNFSKNTSFTELPSLNVTRNMGSNSFKQEQQTQMSQMKAELLKVNNNRNLTNPNMNFSVIQDKSEQGIIPMNRSPNGGQLLPSATIYNTANFKQIQYRGGIPIIPKKHLSPTLFFDGDQNGGTGISLNTKFHQNSSLKTNNSQLSLKNLRNNSQDWLFKVDEKSQNLAMEASNFDSSQHTYANGVYVVNIKQNNVEKESSQKKKKRKYKIRAKNELNLSQNQTGEMSKQKELLSKILNHKKPANLNDSSMNINQSFNKYGKENVLQQARSEAKLNNQNEDKTFEKFSQNLIMKLERERMNMRQAPKQHQYNDHRRSSILNESRSPSSQNDINKSGQQQPLNSIKVNLEDIINRRQSFASNLNGSVINQLKKKLLENKTITQNVEFKSKETLMLNPDQNNQNNEVQENQNYGFQRQKVVRMKTKKTLNSKTHSRQTSQGVKSGFTSLTESFISDSDDDIKSNQTGVVSRNNLNFQSQNESTSQVRSDLPPKRFQQRFSILNPTMSQPDLIDDPNTLFNTNITNVQNKLQLLQRQATHTSSFKELASTNQNLAYNISQQQVVKKGGLLNQNRVNILQRKEHPIFSKVEKLSQLAYQPPKLQNIQ